MGNEHNFINNLEEPKTGKTGTGSTMTTTSMPQIPNNQEDKENQPQIKTQKHITHKLSPPVGSFATYDDSSDEEEGRYHHELSHKDRRVLRMIKHIIGEERVDLQSEQTLIGLIENSRKQNQRVRMNEQVKKKTHDKHEQNEEEQRYLKQVIDHNHQRRRIKHLKELQSQKNSFLV